MHRFIAPPSRTSGALSCSPWILAIAVSIWCALPVVAQSNPFVQWNFNNASGSTVPPPSLNVTSGNPTASTVGLAIASSFPNTPDGESGDSSGNGTNLVWQTNGYSSAQSPAASGSRGVQFSGINTSSVSNLKDVLFSFSIGAPVGASRFYQVQYSVGGGAFQNYGAPVEYIKVDSTTTWANLNMFSLAAIPGAENTSNLQVRIVSVYGPGTTAYQGVGGTYNLNQPQPVSFDLVTFGQANRLNPTVGPNVTLQTASNWSLNDIQTGAPSTNLVFGPNTNGGVSALTINNSNIFNAQSMVFRSDLNKPVTFTGSGLILGTPSNVNYLSGIPTLVNASGQILTFTQEVELRSGQSWDAGSTPGGRLVMAGGVAFSGGLASANNLTVIMGSNPVEAPNGIYSYGTAATVTRQDGVLKLGDPQFSFGSAINYVIGQNGRLELTGSGSSGSSVTSGGSVTVQSGGTLAGVGRISVPTSSGNAVTVAAGGSIRGGSGSTVGTLAVDGNVRLTGAAGTGGAALAVGLSNTGGSISSSLLSVTTGTLTFDDTNGPFVIRLENAAGAGLVPNTLYTFTVATSTGGFRLQKGGSTTNPTTYNAGTDFVLTSTDFTNFTQVSLSQDGMNMSLKFMLTPAPEPVFVVAVAAAGLMGARLLRSRRRAARGDAPAGDPIGQVIADRLPDAL